MYILFFRKLICVHRKLLVGCGQTRAREKHRHKYLKYPWKNHRFWVWGFSHVAISFDRRDIIQEYAVSKYRCVAISITANHVRANGNIREIFVYVCQTSLTCYMKYTVCQTSRPDLIWTKLVELELQFHL